MSIDAGPNIAVIKKVNVSKQYCFLITIAIALFVTLWNGYPVVDIGFYKILRRKSLFIGDATRLWNSAPLAVTSALNLNAAKANVKSYCYTLPI